jgi:hypothetical protein
MFLDGAHDLRRPRLNLLLILAFDHHPQERLGPGVPYQEPSFPVKPAFHTFHCRSNRGNAFEILFVPHAHVDEDLRVRDEL